MRTHLQEAIDEYGDVPLRFSSYRKGEFSFIGTAANGTELRAIYGDPTQPYDIPGFAANTVIYLDPERSPDWHPVNVHLQHPDGTHDEVRGF